HREHGEQGVVADPERILDVVARQVGQHRRDGDDPREDHVADAEPGQEIELLPLPRHPSCPLFCGPILGPRRAKMEGSCRKPSPEKTPRKTPRMKPQKPSRTRPPCASRAERTTSRRRATPGSRRS